MAEFVYFISDGLGTKIGTSTDVEQRLRALQTANPRKLTLLGVLPGGKNLEKQLHKHFAHKRTRGEWFELTETDLRPLLATPQKKERKPQLSWTEPFLDSLESRFTFTEPLRFFDGTGLSDTPAYKIGEELPELEAGVKRTLLFLSRQETVQHQLEVLLLATILDARWSDSRAHYLVSTEIRLNERIWCREGARDPEATTQGALIEELQGPRRCRRYLPFEAIDSVVEKYGEVWYSPEMCLLAIQGSWSRLSASVLLVPDPYLEPPQE